MVDVRPPIRVFVLIHGTFARGAGWTGEDSKLTKSLRDAYPTCEILRFLWTGANSHTARLNAAEELRKFLKSSVDKFPKATIHLIGHSHGGNVAIYALRDVSIAELVTSLVCISTPFLSCTGRDTDKLHVRLGTVIIALLITSIELLCYYIGVRVGAVGLVMLAGNCAAFFAVTVGAKRLGPKIINKLYEKQKAIVDRLDLGRCNTLVFVVRVARDEAALLLRSSYLLSRIPHLVNVIGLLVLLFVGATVALSVFSFGPFAHKPVHTIYLTWFTAAAIALATYGFIAVATFVVRSHPLAFGWEGLFDSIFVDLNISLVPNFPVVEEEIRIRRGFRLRHSALYADDTFVQLLPGWIDIVEKKAPIRATSE